MLYGISGAPISPSLLYAAVIQPRCQVQNFWPCLAYAIACNETILGEYGGKWTASTVVSDDGGHGLFQLTSSFPSDWTDPGANTDYAIDNFLIPALQDWRTNAPDVLGSDLVRAIAATFNAGFGGAWSGHQEGNVDKYTTQNYGARALDIYNQLIAGKFSPP